MKNAAALLEEYSMKRIIAFFLCVLMTAALLAGCGDSGTPAASGSGAPA